MSTKPRKKQANPYLIDDENPEWTLEDVRNSRPAIDVFTEIMGREAAETLVYKGRGRPRKSKPKQLVSVRLDSDVLDAFRARGAGWQTRMNKVLRQWVESHPQ